jgi:hypothetical protein
MTDMTEFEYRTLLNGGLVTVVLSIEEFFDEDGEDRIVAFDGVYFDGVDITPILSSEQINELEMEAEKAMSDYSFELKNE